MYSAPGGSQALSTRSSFEARGAPARALRGPATTDHWITAVSS